MVMMTVMTVMMTVMMMVMMRRCWQKYAGILCLGGDGMLVEALNGIMARRRPR